MSEILYGIGVGLVFALAGITCLLTLIGFGELLEWLERRKK
mgnify:CR=1 FL=1